MVPAAAMTKIALGELDGEIARLSGNLTLAITDFTTAAALEHALPYTEPAYWHQPAAKLLGAALLQLGRAHEPKRSIARSLMSYRLRLGAEWSGDGAGSSGPHDEANATRKEFARAWQLRT